MKLKGSISLALAFLMLIASFVSCTEQTTAITDGETANSVSDTAQSTAAPSDTDTEGTEAPGTASDTAPGTESAEQSTSAETESETETETETEEATTQPDAELGLPSDIVFRSVYGTGVNNDTPVKYGYIELSNTGDKPVDLSGKALLYKTDTSTKYAKLSFPEGTVIEPSASYLIRCGEGKSKTGKPYDEDYEKIRIDYYDVSWSQVIDNKEITLALVDSGTSIDIKADVTKVKSVYSYFIATQTESKDPCTAVGISKNTVACLNSIDKYETVNMKNASASTLADIRPMYSGGDKNTWLSQTANVVTFSHEAGFYDEGFKLKLEALDGYTIYYTTTGKDPRVSGAKYTGAISIGKTDNQSWGSLTRLNSQLNGARLPSVNVQIGGKVIKAYATNGKVSTQVVTKTFFVIPGASDYDVPFLSISLDPDDFVSSDKGIYYTVMKDPFGKKERRTAYLEIIETDGSAVSSSYIELAMNGNGSLGNNSKSMRVYFKSDADPTVVGNPSKLKYDIFCGAARDGVTEYKRLVLRNSGNDSSRSHLRDAYMQALCSELNCPTMAYRPSFLFVNGEFWGVYNIRERYDAKYFEEHYGIQEENFCMLESPSPLITGNGTTMYWLNDGVEGDEQAFYDLYDYIMSHDLSNSTYYQYVADRIDLDNMIDFFVGSMYLCNLDWPTNNIKMWRNKNPDDPSGMDTKWRFVFCDMDMGVGLASNIDNNMFPNAFDSGTIAGNMMKRLLNNSTFKEKFIKRFYECAETVFDEERANLLLDEMKAGIEDVIQLHFNRWPGDGGSMSNFNSHIESIRYFMNNRKEKALAHMQAYFGIQPSQINVMWDSDAATVTLAGTKLENSGYSEIFETKKTVNVLIDVKSGYEYVGTLMYNAEGKKYSFTTKNISVTVSGTSTITVLTRKAGMTAEPMVVTGSRAIFVLDKNGDLYAWGENNLGQLGIQTNCTVTKPIHVASGVIKVATSMGGTEGDAPMTAFITADGKLYTVGNNSNGQLGRQGNAYVVTQVETDFTVADISVGLDHLLVLSDTGELYGCGNNAYGQLGNNNYTGSVHGLVKLASGAVNIAAGRRHSLYTDENGDLYALGDNRWTKIHSSAPEVITSPYKVMSNVKYIAAGQHNSLAITDSGDLYYFGWRGVTGFGAGTSSGVPEKIASDMVMAAIQDEHIVMLDKSGNVYGFGLNNYGQISDDMATKNEPCLMATGATCVGAGTYYSAWILSDGTVMVRGYNGRGVIGNGTTGDYTSPYSPMKVNY